MHLIHHHVLQLLIVHWTREDIGLQVLASDTGKKHVFSRVTVAVLDQNQIPHVDALRDP